MTKGKTIRHPASAAGAPTTGATSAEATSKRQHGKLVVAVGGRATKTGATSPTKCQADAPIPDAGLAATPEPPRQTKPALLRAMLAKPGGASLAALMAATGWQPHTLRAALSGLRKKGLDLTRRREGEDTIYAIAPGGPEAACTGDSVGGPAEDEAATGAGDAGGAGDAICADVGADTCEDSPVPSDAAAASRLTGSGA